MHNIELNVKGMTCGHCVRHVEDAIHQILSNAEVKVDLPNGKVLISGDVQPYLGQILSKLEEEGYPAIINEDLDKRKVATCQSGGGCCCS